MSRKPDLFIGLNSSRGDRTITAAGEAPDRAGLGRDNSVSHYRHNLLTTVFYGASAGETESTSENKPINFNYLIRLRKDQLPLEILM